jgi:hypothetical protein
MPRSELFSLLDELQVLAMGKRFSNQVAPIADDDYNFAHSRLFQCIENVLDHRTFQDGIQHFRKF